MNGLGFFLYLQAIGNIVFHIHQHGNFPGSVGRNLHGLPEESLTCG